MRAGIAEIVAGSIAMGLGGYLAARRLLGHETGEVGGVHDALRAWARETRSPLWVSVGVTLLALLLFGYFKGRATDLKSLGTGTQTLLIGGLADGAAFGLARICG